MRRDTQRRDEYRDIDSSALRRQSSVRAPQNARSSGFPEADPIGTFKSNEHICKIQYLTNSLSAEN